MGKVIEMTEQSLWQSAITKAKNIQLQQNNYKIAVFIANLIAKTDEKINEANKLKIGSQERKIAFNNVHIYQDVLDMAIKDLGIVKYDFDNSAVTPANMQKG